MTDNFLMFRVRHLYVILFFLLMGLGLPQGQGQFFIPPFSGFAPEEVSLVSHYPPEAYTTQRLLPFSVIGANQIEVVSARVTRGDGCTALMDPHHKHNIHLQCRKPGLVVAEVMFNSGQRQNLIFIVGPLEVRELRPEGSGGEGL